MAVKENYLVKKRNVLNELRATSMTLQELRFLSIYLSKINPADEKTRVVRFSLKDFKSIMEFGRVNIEYMKNITNSLLSKIVNVPTESGGYEAFQLFKRCRVDADEKNEWYVEIDAHDEALPLLFDYKNNFFTYPLGNALRLRSPNQLRMYEILKQYETIGTRIMTIEKVKDLLGISKNEYERYNNFKQWVLDACQKTLAESSDICFTYEPYGKRGKGGKILSLKFTITKNEDVPNQMTLGEFITLRDETIVRPSFNRHDEAIALLADSCDNEFSEDEMEVILDLVTQAVPGPVGVEHADYLQQKYHELQVQATKRKISSRFGYLKKMIQASLEPQE